MRQGGETRTVFPVGLLTEGRAAVVVGGGRIATRKVGLLLDAGARVTVVSPLVSETLTGLAEAGRIAVLRRRFNEHDVEGALVVFAATDDPEVNRQVLTICGVRRVLCCCVDRHWRDGDFVTPAVLRRGSLAVSISTGGRSCRQSRLIRNSLARHIASVEDADLVVVGGRAMALTAAQRKEMVLTEARIRRLGAMVMQISGCHEFMLVGSREGAELVAVASAATIASGLLARVMAVDVLPADAAYTVSGQAAFDHLALAAAGVYDETTGAGSPESRLQEAFDDAMTRAWADAMMRDWLDASLEAAAAIRRAARADAVPIAAAGRQVLREKAGWYEAIVNTFQGGNAGQ